MCYQLILSFFYSINVIQLIERLLHAKPYASKGKEMKEENQECQDQDGSGLQFAVECSGWAHRRVTFEPRCQRGELCPNLVNHNNHKSKAPARTDSIWKGATESPDIGI